MVGIEAIATAFGSRLLTNAELELAYPEWDFQRLGERTGVFARPIAIDGETALDFAERAARKLVDDGRLQPDEIDGVIFCTETPDYVIPPNACVLHQRLKLPTNVAAFDITLACSGYPYALMLARSMIDGGAARNVLVATADTYSHLIHPGDRATRVLFGDGGAVSLVTGRSERFRILDIMLGTSGDHYQRFIVKAGGTRMPRSEATREEHQDKSGNIRNAESIEMDGFGVLSFFNTQVPKAVRELLAKHTLDMNDIDLIVCHQASKLALEGVRKGIGADPDKFVIDISETGNMVSASIPVALARAEAEGRIKRGQRIILCGFGVGLSWGTALIEA
jgi:3-oxoacyl-[acyl-carrier-protein] synthase-3